MLKINIGHIIAQYFFNNFLLITIIIHSSFLIFKQTSCQNSVKIKPKRLLGLNGYQTIRNDELLMKTALDKIGPLIVSFNVAGLYNYKPGDIINDPNCSSLVNHNALAVGYGTDEATGLDYYIVKNSWGSKWGKIIISFFLFYDFLNFILLLTN